MTSTKSSNRYEFGALLAILILAAVLRFAYPGVNSFAGDEAHISLDALRMARGGEFVMAGQDSSVGIPFFPASVWLFALPYALSPDPLVATGFVSLISLIMVAGVWWLGRRWNAWAGLVAGLYMATSPYAVFYGRSIWQPNLLAPLALAWAISAYLGATRSDRGGRFGVGAAVFLGLFAFQVHFAGIALVPATAYLFLRWRWWRRLIPVVVGAGLALAAILPYVYYVTVINPSVLQRYSEVLGGGAAAIDLQAIENLVRLALGWDWAFLGMGNVDTFSRTVLTAIAAGALVGVGLVAAARETGRRTRADSDLSPVASTSPLHSVEMRMQTELLSEGKVIRPHRLKPAAAKSILAELVLLGMIASPLVFLQHSTPVLIHYQLIAFPALALLAGGSTLLFGTRVWKMTVAGVMLALAAVWSIQTLQTLAYTAENRPPNSALSSILRESRDAAYQPEAPILFFTHGDNPAVDGEVAVFKTLLWERGELSVHHDRILNGDNLLILPPYPATLLATLAPFQAWEEIEAAGLVAEVQTYPRRVGADPFIATSYDGVSDPQGFTAIEPIPFADGTTLLGWKVRRVGDRLRVSTLWRVESDAAPGMYQQFHHLRNDAGADEQPSDSSPLAISDVALSRETWRVGDRVIVMADFFEIAPGTEALSVEIGHYTLGDLARVARLNSGGTLVQLGAFDAP
ncbi:MAG: hypothetical protein ABI835_14250 [Chloroflexota bacterium]